MRRNGLPEDPVVAEVRAARQKLWRLGGGTVSGFFRAARELLAAPAPKRKASARAKAKKSTSR